MKVLERLEKSPKLGPESFSMSHAKRKKSTCMVHHLLNLDLPPEKREGDYSTPNESRTNLETLFESKSRSASQTNLPLMSKDALSEMVVSVRELSFKLSNLNMKLHMRNILIVSKIHERALVPITRDLALWLISLKTMNGTLNVYVQDILQNDADFRFDEVRAKYPDHSKHMKFWTQQMCTKNPNLFDFVITLGGDGTVLYTSWLFQRVVPPVLCFGFGSLGFMTEYDFKDKEETIMSILENGVSCSLRMRFECTIMRSTGNNEGKDYTSLANEMDEAARTGVFANHKMGETYCILNDVVVDRGPNPTITTTELYGDFKFLTAIQADGVVISTPSGSTAYSLSAGGSLVHPDIPGVLISPICPHTLSFRPLVLPNSLIVRVGVPYDARVSAWCGFDGKCRVELKQGDFLTVSASPYPFPKVHDGNSHTSWFTRLSETLHWNERKRQKAYNYDDVPRAL